MKNFFFTFRALFIAGILIILSCARKDSSPAEVTNLFKQAENEAITEVVLQKADDQINKEITMLESLNYNIPASKSGEAAACNAKITIEKLAATKFPKIITLDFGSGCTDSLGNFRAGKIIVNITGPYWEKNTVRNSKLVDYVYNDLKIAGERNEINKGTNDKGYYVFEVKHKEKISSTKGDLLIEREWMRVRNYNRGMNLLSIDDDEVWVTGSSAVQKNGKETVQEITTPLYRKITCQNFQSGVVTTFIKKEKAGELNYGTGVCDNIATWTNGQVTKTITLKTWINYYSTKQ
jgi:hypothetical protein